MFVAFCCTYFTSNSLSLLLPNSSVAYLSITMKRKKRSSIGRKRKYARHAPRDPNCVPTPQRERVKGKYKNRRPITTTRKSNSTANEASPAECPASRQFGQAFQPQISRGEGVKGAISLTRRHFNLPSSSNSNTMVKQVFHNVVECGKNGIEYVGQDATRSGRPKTK